MRLWRRKSNNGGSQEALQKAEDAVRTAERRNIEVYEVSGTLRRLRQKNHFAEDIYLVMRGHS